MEFGADAPGIKRPAHPAASSPRAALGVGPVDSQINGLSPWTELSALPARLWPREDRDMASDSDFLLVVDVQNDFCPGGALAVRRGDEVVAPINRVGRRFAHLALTQDWHPRDHRSFASQHQGRRPFETIAVDYGDQILWPDHCVQGTEGAAFHPDLDLPHAQLILRKGFSRHIDSYSAFFENDRRTPTGLVSYLRERGFRQLYLAGLATDYCVAYSALDAIRQGFAATVLDDACRAIDLDGSLDRAMGEMRQAGVAFASTADDL
jgi:nicotinamidase/pyrazinamidase